MTETTSHTVRYEDGRMNYEGEWFFKGDHVVFQSRQDIPALLAN